MVRVEFVEGGQRIKLVDGIHGLWGVANNVRSGWADSLKHFSFTESVKSLNCRLLPVGRSPATVNHA